MPPEEWEDRIGRKKSGGGQGNCLTVRHMRRSTTSPTEGGAGGRPVVPTFSSDSDHRLLRAKVQPMAKKICRHVGERKERI
ncbi:unnamed protein product [Strongylus vulgaris]|uniref:Uncharacterized protein n=1 Tax=Strongylus vulgaris TaxID=40348 RepID=A0A3P7IYU1_STRVU|nr:unnamed protein product [Strongylus vulgaris]